MKQPLFQKLDQLSMERWARQSVRTLLRAAWLSVCIWCIALGGRLVWGWSLPANFITLLALVAVGGAVLLLLLRPRLSAHRAARRLDQRFHLDEQLSTAVEVAATNPQPGSIGARLVLESAHTAALLQRRIAQRQSPPWQDLLTLLALGVVALGLMIMTGIGVPNLAGGVLPLPPLAVAEDPAQQLPQEPQSQDQQQADQAQTGAPGDPSAAGQSSAPDPRTLGALADALRDQGATRPAAEALDRGDTAGAAQSLRELADQASQLSEQSRNDLADQLENAAQQIGGSNQQLSDQLRNSADGLREGGQDAAEALDDLARAIEQLGQNAPEQQAQNGQPGASQGAQNGQSGQEGQSGQQGQGNQPSADEGQGQGQGDSQGGSASGAGNGSGEQRQAGQNNPLNVEGQPLELESSGEGQVPAQASGKPPTGTGASSNGGFTQGDTSSGQRVQVGADPLRVPIDERDVVQDYFQPQR